MKRTSLIRLGGLVAIVGGVASTAVFLLGDLLVALLPLGPLERSIQSGSIQGPILNLLVVGAMAAIVAIAVLHTLQPQHSMRNVVLASLAAFAGLVMCMLGFLAFTDTLLVFVGLVIVGLVIGTLGIIALGIMITDADVLPWWCGVSLALGSPLPGFVFFIWGLGGLLGVPWAVVGYALFRAVPRQAQQPSRVR